MEQTKAINSITADVIDVAIRLHRTLGPGLLESVYETILAAKLQQLGYDVARQQPVNIEFEGLHFDRAFIVDLLIDRRLVIEIESVAQISPVHAKQLLTYIRLLKQPIGLLLNFGGETMKEGIRRLANDYKPLCASAPLREIGKC